MAADIVNPQITDSVTQTNTKVLGDAPAMAMGSLYQTIGNAMAMAAANAVYAQQQANITYQAATTMGVSKILSGDIGSKTAPNIHSASCEQLEAHIQNLEAQIAQAKEQLNQKKGQ